MRKTQTESCFKKCGKIGENKRTEEMHPGTKGGEGEEKSQTGGKETEAEKKKGGGEGY